MLCYNNERHYYCHRVKWNRTHTAPTIVLHTPYTAPTLRVSRTYMQKLTLTKYTYTHTHTNTHTHTHSYKYKWRSNTNTWLRCGRGRTWLSHLKYAAKLARLSLLSCHRVRGFSPSYTIAIVQVNTSEQWAVQYEVVQWTQRTTKIEVEDTSLRLDEEQQWEELDELQVWARQRDKDL